MIVLYHFHAKNSKKIFDPSQLLENAPTVVKNEYLHFRFPDPISLIIPTGLLLLACYRAIINDRDGRGWYQVPLLN